MGFLSVNTRKRRGLYPKSSKKLDAKRRRSTSPEQQDSQEQGSSEQGSATQSREPSPPVQNAVPNLAPIERLPREVLERIFVLAGSFNLAQASPILASKLSRTRTLELGLMRTQLDLNGNKMPTHVAYWPFVNAQLLSELNFTEFVSSAKSDSPFVPFTIEDKVDNEDQADTYLELVAFMVERGCFVENSIRMYNSFAKRGYWNAIQAMAKNKQRANSEVVVLALKSGQGAELAIQLLSLSHGLEQDWAQLWEIQQAAIEAQLPEISVNITAS